MNSAFGRTSSRVAAVWLAAWLATVVASGCTSGSNEEASTPAADLIVRPPVLSLHAGETIQIAVQVNDSAGRPIGGAPIDFFAGSTSIVRVSHVGVLSAVGPAGQDSIRISSGTHSRVIPVTVGAGPPSVVEIASVQLQTGLAGTSLEAPVVVTIRDAYGNTVPRAAVHFATEAGGEASPATVNSDAAGIARSVWTLGPLAGTQGLRVQADSASTVVEAIARPGTMSQIQNIDPVSRRTHAGDSVPVKLRATDAFGNGVAGVVFAFSVDAGRGTVLPARVESDSIGLAHTSWRTGTTAGPNSLRVHAFQVQDTNFVLAVRTIGGTPTTLTLVSGDNQRARTLTTVSRAPIVRVTDQYGNPVSAVRITFSTTVPSAQIDPLELVTDDQGRATLRSWTLGAAGEQTMIVVADGIADTLRIKARATPR